MACSVCPQRSPWPAACHARRVNSHYNSRLLHGMIHILAELVAAHVDQALHRKVRVALVLLRRQTPNQIRRLRANPGRPPAGSSRAAREEIASVDRREKKVFFKDWRRHSELAWNVASRAIRSGGASSRRGS